MGNFRTANTNSDNNLRRKVVSCMMSFFSQGMQTCTCGEKKTGEQSPTFVIERGESIQVCRVLWCSLVDSILCTTQNGLSTPDISSVHATCCCCIHKCGILIMAYLTPE